MYTNLQYAITLLEIHFALIHSTNRRNINNYTLIHSPELPLVLQYKAAMYKPLWQIHRT